MRKLTRCKLRKHFRAPKIGLSRLQNVVVGFVTTILKVSAKTKTGMITNNAMVICRKDKYCHSWFYKTAFIGSWKKEVV